MIPADVPRDELEELVTEAWLSRAPARMVAEHLGTGGHGAGR